MGANNVAAGDAAGATAAAGAVAIGNNNQAIGQGSVALGNASKALAAGALALGDTATANNAKDVALGSGSTTAAAVGTGSTTIGGTVYNFAGANPASTVSVGAAGSERTVTNVAAGRISGTSTDAINGSQLYATNQAVQAIAASTPLHYYSVNDAGTQQANYINNGATGNNSMAAGVAASASGNSATAVGQNTSATGEDTVAIGGNSVAGNAAKAAAIGSVAIGGGSISSAAAGASVTAAGDNGIAIGTLSAVSAKGGTAIGQRAVVSGSSSLAIGDIVTASGVGSVAIGPNVVASGVFATAMGQGAAATAANSTALGNGSSAKAASTVAFGDSNTVAATAGTGSIAGGHNSQVTGGSGAVALGEGQVANGNGAVAIGDPNSAIGTGAVTVGANNTSNGQGAIALGNANSATGQGAIALGNASTAAAAGGIALGDTANAALGNGVAIGANAKADNANDVALGAGSTSAAPHAGVTAQFGGAAAGIAKAASGVVSLGAAGAERQIQNVAAGVISAASTDAINGSQLNAVVTGINNLGTTTASTLGGGAAYNPATGNVAGFSQPINTVSAAGAVTGPTAQTTVAGALTALNANVDNTANIAVKYDAVGGTKITLGATGGAGAGAPVTITNLAPAALNATSTDAVNGSQLFGTNQNVANITNGKAGPFVSDNSLTAVQPVSSGANTSAGGFGATATGAASTVVGNQATDNGNANATVLGQGASIAAGTTGSNVALGQASTVTTAAVPTTGATIGGTAYTFAGGAPTGVVSVGSAGNDRQITNVAAGQLSGASTDAVNGSQLFATNQQVTANTTAITNINNGGGIKYFHADSTLADSTATGTDSVAVGPTANATATDAMALGHGSAATNAGAVALGAGSTTAAAVATPGATINGTAYNYAGTAPTSTVSIGSVGNERTITNVAAGRVSGTSTDAVNGSQLFATDTAVTSLGNTVNNITNGKAGPFVSDNSLTAVQPVSSGANASAGGFGATATGAASTVLGNQATDNGNANATVLGQGASIAAGTTGSNVALGQGSTVTTAAVPTTGATIGGTAYTFAGGAPTGVVSVGSAGNDRQITNVAAGQLSGASTDAVNGSQLFATNQQVTANTTAITNINNGGGIKYFHANSTLADSAANGADSVAIGPVSTAGTANAVSIGNGATAGANAGDVALGAGSTTAVAVGTPSTTIAGATYNFVGTTPTSTVSVGAVGAERTITNVAAGRISGSSTDAINGSQLFATNQAVDNLNSTVTANATHYYSVNDNGTHGGNYTNNGATGINALAAGVGAVASADNSTSLGQNTNVSILGGVALGSGAVSDRAIAPSSGSILVGTNVIPYNTTDRILRGAVSVGNATDFRQITNMADGTTDQDAVTLRQLKGAMSSFSVTPIKYFHANSTAADSAAIGAESVAIGPKTTVNGDNGIGMGNGAIVQQTAPGGTAIGQNATVNLADGVALGTNATSNGVQAMALGAGTQAAFAGSVALGAGSKTDAAVGTASTIIAGTTYNFAGTTPGSTVSVGATGAERTLTNVAAGQLNTGSTDAVNGSQLNATNLAIAASKTHYYSVNDGGTQGGNYNNNGATGVDALAAGVGSSASAANDVAIGNLAAASGGSSIAIGDGAQASGANSISIGTGNIVSGASSVAIGDPTTITGAGSFSVGNNNNIASNNTFVFGSNVRVPTGLDGSVVLGNGSAAAAATPVSSATVNGATYGGFAGTTPTSTVSVGTVGAERQITNVAAGQITATSTDAINGSQLYSVANGLGTAVNNLTTVVNANQFPIASSEGKAFAGSIGAAGSNSLGMGTNAVATGQNSTAAGQGSVASQANTTALGQGAQATAANSTALGQGAVAGTGNSVAIGNSSATTAAVATAGTTIHGTSYSFAGGAPVGTVSVGSAGNERQIQNVAAGQLSATSTDAINGSQLYATNSAINNLTNVVTSTQVKYYSDNSSGGGNVNNDGATGTDAMAMGKNTTASGGNAVAVGPGASATASNGVAIGAGSTADRAGLGGAKESFSNTAVASTQGAVSVGSAGNERQITNVAGGTQATDAVNVRQLQAVQAAGVHYDNNADGSTNYSSVTMGNGGSSPVAIHNVDAGTAPTDAVNVSQLNTGLNGAVERANQHADGLAMQLQNNINDVAKKAYAGVAAAMSMESAPYVAGKITYSAGYGYYQNQNAIGVSLRRTADNGRWSLSGGVSGTTAGGVAARLAVSGVLN
ncbi:hep_Hag family protein [Collimonas pratensis]|uniref:Hep_Hag family protein n=1 Tax=Collimonas pratensis TaxID=279113 RepID=A0ABM5Z0L5_9BURK|nr:hep_Hag family protein [Collimonas pratensis]